ncbi:MAG TPA: RpiR family transcriptional regulator, partial [Burkholderiaceae bacterium]
MPRAAASKKTAPPKGSPPPVPASHSPAVDALLERISAEFGGLSRQLKLIARYVEQHRDHLGLEKIQDVAARSGVQPSAVVRFAKHFGFSGYTELQKVFRDGLSHRLAPDHNYQARIRDVIDHAQGRLSSADIAGEWLAGTGGGEPLGGAVFLLAAARGIVRGGSWISE